MLLNRIVAMILANDYDTCRSTLYTIFVLVHAGENTNGFSVSFVPPLYIMRLHSYQGNHVAPAMFIRILFFCK